MAAAACGGSGADLTDELDAVVEAGAPGALVLVRDGGRVERLAAGFADLEAKRPLQAGDRFRVGSVTKTFVATLVLQLVDEGALGLGDSVDDWVPGLVRGGDRITVQALLSHTSGLPDYVDDLGLTADERWRPRELIELALADPEPPPDRSFSYASTNYLVLQLIVEAVTGTPLEHELDRRIFRPLGLRSTSFEPGRITGAHAHGYRPPSHGGIVTGAPVDTGGEAASWTWAAGAVVSTADDLAEFFRALLGGELVPPRLLGAMQTLVPAGRYRYGLGLAVFPTPCGQAWGHTGNANGYVTVVWNTRDASKQLVLMTNSYPLSAELEAAFRRIQIAAFCG